MSTVEDDAESVLSWDFNVFALSSNEQIDCVVTMFRQLNLIETFALSESTLREFATSLRSTYEDNPFHNFTHALDVTQAMFVLLTTMNVQRFLRPLDVYTLMLACLCHDSGHPGLTNAFLIATESPLARDRIDSSVLERHHCATAHPLLKRAKMFASLTRTERAEFRSAFQTIILATDMAKHSTLTDRIAMFIASRNDDALISSDLPEHRELLMITTMKFCDISNVFREPALAHKWLTRITDEYYAQGDQMLARHMSPVPDMMNRHSNTPRQEITRQFILTVVMSFFNRCRTVAVDRSR